MWQVQPGPVTGPFDPPPAEGHGRPEHAQPEYAQQAYGQPGHHLAAPPAYDRPAAYGQHPAAYDAPPAAPERSMTAQDFLAHRHRTVDIGPATWGWRGLVRRLTFGLVTPKMGRAEREYRESRATVQRSFSGPRTIVFANPKGGAAKTTSVLAAGYTFGTIRGGGVVAWDNNETRGTLGIRGERANHQNTTRELLDDLQRFQDVYESRIGDLGAFVRSQGDAHFDVLASDERADVTGQIKASDFGAVHRLLERFYHLILVDTGNNLRAENWLAAAQTADLIVVTCTVREDTGYSGLWMLDALQDAGHHNLKDKTITVLADPSSNVDDQLAKDLVEVYEQRTGAVFRVPYDPTLVAGSVIQYGQLSEATRAAWLKACAAMAAAL
jgi:MinD-like ATPase involved in chromosome partitioning or flagellar assembly